MPTLAQAHLILLEPAATLIQDQRGDPQKLGPCGGTSADPGTSTRVVSKIKGGAPLHVTIRETIYHPGHYRVALVTGPASELPPDPVAETRDTPRGPWSVSAPIQNPPTAPVIADGLFQHTSRPTELYQTEVQIPNISCKKCTLQVTQFMIDHGLNKDGGFYYHHCAELEIAADPAKPIDPRWPSPPTQ
jgi:hypothetical protein